MSTTELVRGLGEFFCLWRMLVLWKLGFWSRRPCSVPPGLLVQGANVGLGGDGVWLWHPSGPCRLVAVPAKGWQCPLVSGGRRMVWLSLFAHPQPPGTDLSPWSESTSPGRRPTAVGWGSGPVGTGAPGSNFPYVAC